MSDHNVFLPVLPSANLEMNMIPWKKVFLVFLLVGSPFLVACDSGDEQVSAEESGEDPVGNEIIVGSKEFTENVILGYITAYLLDQKNQNAFHRSELGGTRVCWEGLVEGQIDVYPDYTGTIREEILAGRDITSREEMREALAEQGIEMTDSLGFENSYVIGMREEHARELGIETISDLRDHPDLRFGFTNEFMDREDGWRSLKEAYNLPQTNVDGMRHEAAYEALDSESVDVIDIYQTDARIRRYNIRRLRDDQDFFTDYSAVLLYRSDLRERAPGAVETLQTLEGRISPERMVDLNMKVSLEGAPEEEVASRYLREAFQIERDVQVPGRFDRIWKRTREHLYLVAISMFGAILIGILLGIVASKTGWFGQGILGSVGILQTVPALALLVIMMPLLGIGDGPAIFALFLYSLLPIVRNTYTGIQEISPEIRESAIALGLSPLYRLLYIELPLSFRSILAGIKISAVINVGTATLGALIGAGGYGQPILTGIRLGDDLLILEGALPASIMAIFIQQAFEHLETFVVSRGLQLETEA